MCPTKVPKTCDMQYILRLILQCSRAIYARKLEDIALSTYAIAKQHVLQITSSTQWPHIENICVGLALVRVLELCVADEDGVHVAAGVLVQLLVAGDHDNGDLHVAENAELVGFL